MYLYTMKTMGMKRIVPAVIIAIAGLLAFQINWLLREARMKEEDEKHRIIEAIHAACFNLEKREAVGIIGNSLDSVFMIVENSDTTTQHVIVINDSVIRQHYDKIPPPVDAHGNPPPPPIPPMPPYPRGPKLKLDSTGPDSGKMVVMRRTERMKSAVQDVMMQYIFQSGDPASRVQPKVIDSLIRLSFQQKGIDYPYSLEIHDRFEKHAGDSALALPAPPGWRFEVPVFPGDPDPNRMQLVVFVDADRSSVWLLLLPQIAFAVLITGGMLVLFILIYREAMKQKKIGEIRRDFINNMTHEFKTPLATMSLAADTIMNEKVIGDKDKVRHYAEQIKNENRKLNLQVEKVLELSLTEKQGLKLTLEPVNLKKLLEQAIAAMQLQVESRAGAITLDGDLDDIMMVQADPFHLERVFMNLVDNALKYGGIPPIIRISVEKYRSGVSISFTDNGKGIPRSEWETVFEPFHRVSTGDIHTVKGFGLGLSYARSVVNEHNGSLSVSKSSISGTTFTLVLLHE